METLLEQQRRFHEEKERRMDAMVKEMLLVKKTVCSVLLTCSDVQPVLCLVLFFFIVDHEMDSHAENKNPSRKKCVIN